MFFFLDKGFLVNYNNPCYAAVAQLDRVLGYEPRGRGFESLRLHHKSLKSQMILGFYSKFGKKNTNNGPRWQNLSEKQFLQFQIFNCKKLAKISKNIQMEFQK